MNLIPDFPYTTPPIRTGYVTEQYFDIRTDLAVEETEKHQEKGCFPFSGVTVDELDEQDGQIHVTRVIIESNEGAAALGKSIGTYITLDAVHMDENDGESHRKISRILAKYLHELMEPKLIHMDHNKYRPSNGSTGDTSPSILVVGLGNSDVTPDALGPRVLSNLLITRHLKTGQFQFPSFHTDGASVCGIVPGVMAQTGMETAEIIKALTDQIHPDMIIVIDALAARSVTRLGTTVQLTDTGIHPGSGVGNHRQSLTQESLGVPVIAIGVPTVVGAAAIVTDTLDALIDVLRRETDTAQVANTLRSMNPDEKYMMVRQLLEPRFGPMFVTPKDIDETIKRLSYTISEGINMALFGDAASRQKQDPA